MNDADILIIEAIAISVLVAAMSGLIVAVVLKVLGLA